jgi:hypothetical protein
MEDRTKLIKLLEQIIIDNEADGNMASCVLDCARIALKSCGYDVRVFYSYEAIDSDFVLEMENKFILEANLPDS